MEKKKLASKACAMRTQREKIKRAKQLKDAGWPDERIAGEVGVSLDSIKNWVKPKRKSDRSKRK